MKCPIPNCQVENPHQHGSGVGGPKEFWICQDSTGDKNDFIAVLNLDELTDVAQKQSIHVIKYDAYDICLQKLEDKKERVRELEHAMKQISEMDSFEYEKGGAYRIAEKSLKGES